MIFLRQLFVWIVINRHLSVYAADDTNNENMFFDIMSAIIHYAPLSFLDAIMHLYTRSCPSFRWSVGP